VIEAYLDGTLLQLLQGRVEHALRDDLPALRSEEAAVLAFLQRRLSQEIATRERTPADPNLKAALRESVAEGRTAAPG
jgi:DNA topoisomerase I